MTSRRHRDLWVLLAIIIIFIMMVVSWGLIPYAIGFKDSVYR